MRLIWDFFLNATIALKLGRREYKLSVPSNIKYSMINLTFIRMQALLITAIMNWNESTLAESTVAAPASLACQTAPEPRM